MEYEEALAAEMFSERQKLKTMWGDKYEMRIRESIKRVEHMMRARKEPNPLKIALELFAIFKLLGILSDGAKRQILAACVEIIDKGEFPCAPTANA